MSKLRKASRFTTHATSRDGFTLIELLVVIGVIGLLVSITLPVVSAVREGSRRTICQNNLRQIGLALQAYHNSKNRFPPGGIELRLKHDLSQRQLAWSAFLLPYLEQNNLFEQLDLGKAFDSDENKIAAAVVLPVYLCPTSVRGTRLVDGRGPCDYGGIYGERIFGSNRPPRGIMIYDQPIRSTQVSDGLTNTLIVAEDAAWSDGQWINGRNIFDQAFAINSAPDFENDIRSLHPNGANALRADGSVRFLDESLDLKVLAAICTRDGGEVVPDY